MATFRVGPALFPRDCDGEKLTVNQTVYLPNGWSGTKPRPWKKATVQAVLCVSERWWVDVVCHDGDGTEMRIPAQSVARYQPYPEGQTDA